MEKYWQETETVPLHEMRALQSLNLCRTVRHVYEHVPFYRERFDAAGIKPEDIRSVDDLSKLPFTYKQDLRDNYPYGLFAVPHSEIVRIHASSGTTGKQTVVGYTENDLKLWGNCCARALTAAGGDSNSYVHVAYGYGLFTGGLGIHNGAEAIHATVIPASTGNTKRQVQIIRDFGSTILCCTPSYAIVIGETMREMGLTAADIGLKAGFFGAEPWTDGMRREIESLLGLRAQDIYGLSEIMGPGVSFECAEQQGLHVNEDHFIPEIIDPDTGEVLPEGELGELVFTCVTKEALPLIRYRTRDIASLTREPCACGRTLIRMTKPCGRTDDMLIIRGVNVFPSQIESVLLDLGMTPHYQIIVDRTNNLDTMQVLVEMGENMEFDAVKLVERTERKIKAAIDSTLGISAKVQLVSPKTIERSMGKAQRVIDNRKQCGETQQK